MSAERGGDTMCCGAQPPYSVSYIDPEVCATGHDQWFVMGTVDGDPRDQCGPVAICEYEPSAHVIAALLNACGGCVTTPCPTPCPTPDDCTRLGCACPPPWGEEDQRRMGEAFCGNCPDHEACSLGYSCSVVKDAAPDHRGGDQRAGEAL